MTSEPLKKAKPDIEPDHPNSVRAGLRLSLAALVINLLLAIIKTAAGIFGRSNALIADGIESTADILSSLVVWGGLRLAIKPPDADHPYGHGKAEPIASIVVSLMLLGAGLLIAVRSIQGLTSAGREPPEWFTLPVLLLVILVKETLFRLAFKTGRGLGSSALQSDAWHHRSDALTSAAAFLGISIALIGGSAFASADDWAALAACGVITFNALRLLRGALDEVMDASVAPELIEQVRHLAAQVDGVVGIDKCRMRKAGLHRALDIHVVVNGNLSVRRGHEISHEVKDRLLEANLRLNDVMVHIEPD